MNSEAIFFLLAGTAIVGALLTVSQTRALHSAWSFGVTLLACAGIFVQLKVFSLAVTELLLLACVLTGLIGFAVEVAGLDVATVSETRGRAKFAGWCAASAVLLEALALFGQRRWFARQSLIALIPTAPLGEATTASSSVLKFLFTADLLPVALTFTIVLIAVVGFGALYQRRA